MTMWHLLQVSDVLDIEFGSALAERVPLLAWEPAWSVLPPFFGKVSAQVPAVPDSRLQVRTFPLMRGYARFPLSTLVDTGKLVCGYLLKETEDPANSPLICTTPYLAPVATRWPGAVVYWLTDRMECYRGANQKLVHSLDEQMCRAATLVCPNSQRLADYLAEWGRCPEEKICVLPNATRRSNLLPTPPQGPAALPETLKDLPRPIAGVIGNLAGNLDWLFLEGVIGKTPAFSWAFVGPTSMAIQDAAQKAARDRVMKMARTRFVGKQTYGALAAYARSFDVAVLPYRGLEPTFSGSSTRFYEHLAACRPMIATRSFDELTRKEPLLRLVDEAGEAAILLEELHARNFDDGLTRMRWLESQSGTWQNRAETMERELKRVMGVGETSDALE